LLIPHVRETLTKFRFEKLSGGVGVRRSAESVLQARSGSCSGKHLALALLLQTAGHKDVEILSFHCDFSAAVDVAASSSGAPASMGLPPAGLLEFIGDGTDPDRTAVHDFHHAVSCGGELLDATWPDSLAPYGFRVNSGWMAGSGGTLLAVPDAAVFQKLGAVSGQQLSAMKATMVGTLTEAQVERRTAFFVEVTQWLAVIQA
jgi:hypothetical protein